MSKNAAVHVGYGEGKHDYVAPERESFGARGSTLRGRSERPGRVKRYKDGQEAMQRHREAVPYCEAPGAGIESPCGTGLDAILEQSHVIAKGLGGGKDYGDVKSLCRKHHAEIDTRRAEMRAAGLTKHAPRPAKVVPRPVESVE